MAHQVAKPRFLHVTMLARLVIALLLLITFALAAAHWAEQQSARSACLVIADHTSDGIWLADVDRGVGAALQQPHIGARPHLFTATFPNSSVVIYVDEDKSAATNAPYGHLGIL